MTAATFLREVLKTAADLDIPIDVFALTDFQYILLGRDGERVIYGHYLATTPGPISGRDDASLLSTNLVDNSYKVYIYACSRWPYPSEVRPVPSKGCVSVSLYRMYDEGLRLATLLELDYHMGHVDLLCYEREACNIPRWSNLEMYIVPVALVDAVAGRALSSLVCQLGCGDGTLCRIRLSGRSR
jgi:hypothetical protein